MLTPHMQESFSHLMLPLRPFSGSYLLCPEFRSIIAGIEYADSFNFNPHKGRFGEKILLRRYCRSRKGLLLLAMMINFDCSPLWFKNAAESIRYFNVDAEYLKHEHQTVAMDYRVGIYVNGLYSIISASSNRFGTSLPLIKDLVCFTCPRS